MLQSAVLTVLLLSQTPAGPARIPPPSSPQFAKAWDHKRFSHRLLDTVLRRHVKRGRVDYAGIKKHSRAILGEYLHRVSKTNPKGFEGGLVARRAFWINAYNALVLREVSERLPQGAAAKTFTIKTAPGFFDRRAHRVGGRWLTLDQMQALTLFDGRAATRFAMVKPALGSPRLIARAWTARRIKKGYLERALRRYLKDPSRGLRWDAAKGILWISTYLQGRLKAASSKANPTSQVVALQVSGLVDRVLMSTLSARKTPVTIRLIPFSWTLNRR